MLAHVYGTPLLVIDIGIVDAAIDALAESAPPGELELSYAGKAFANVEFFRHLAGRSVGLDVCSLGEIVTAERAGFPPERITLHGAGKTDDELDAAQAGRVGTIAADSVEELTRLGELSHRGCAASVILRLNLGITAATHASVRTGDDTKFGLSVRDQVTAAEILRANPQLRFSGLHAHIGSQIAQREPYLAAVGALLDAAGRFDDAGLPVERIVIGGGFAVATEPDGKSLDAAATIGAAARALTRWAGERKRSTPRLGIEPGRAVVALAGTTLYRVLAVKRQTLRTFVVVDGGIAENPRPALYGAVHYVVTSAPARGDLEKMTLCGRSCENDELGNVELPSSIRNGDLVAMCATGAYTYSMAGNYNRFARPAVAAVRLGAHRLLARRETLDDVLRSDVMNPSEALGRSRSV